MPMHLGDAPQGVCTSCRRTLIRKTSLLHKINPTALRSSFADDAFAEACATANAWRLRASHDSRHMERLDQSSLHDVRQHARRGRSLRRANSFFSTNEIAEPSGGARRDRTDDLLLAKQALSQLSYGPVPVSTDLQKALAGLPSRSSRAAIARLRPSGYGVAAFAALRERRLVGLGRFELPTSRLSSARSNQLSYKPEPGVSGQKPAIRNKSDYRILMTDSWSARSRRKRNEDGGVPPMDLTGLMRSVLMFPRDPIKTREASLKDHP